MQTLRNSLFLLLTAAFLIACSPNITPEKAAQNYIDTILANDIDGFLMGLMPKNPHWYAAN